MDKYCGGCSTTKSVSDFYPHTQQSGRSGYRTPCRQCAKEKAATRYAENPKRYSERNRDWQRRNSATAQIRAHHLSMDDFAVLIVAQAGRCGNAACAEPLVDKIMHIDHKHSCCPGPTSCGRCVRGLLCKGCNAAAGMLKDSPQLARGVAEYLEYSGA